MLDEFKSTHDLDFETAEWITSDYSRFRIGTMTGLWSSDDDSYSILAMENSESGNGHFQDMFDWFENSCKRDKRNLVILEVWNGDLYRHLIEKRGFEQIPSTPHVIKRFKPC